MAKQITLQSVIDATKAKDGQFKCPLHDDRVASASVSANKGRVLVHCHAGCNQAELWEKVVEMVRESEGETGGAPASVRGAYVPWRVQCTYRNAQNKGVEALRFDWGGGVGCPQRGCRDTEKHKHCLPGKGGRPAGRMPVRGLYPHVWGTMGEMIVVEGEQAAQAVLLGGYTGVSWYGGAAMVQHAIWDKLDGTGNVKGSGFYLWPDADEPGYRAMVTAGKALLEAGGNILGVVMVAGAAKGDDAADYDASKIEALLASESVISWGDFVAEYGGKAADAEMAEMDVFAPGYHQTLDMRWLLEEYGERLMARRTGLGDAVALMVCSKYGRWHHVGARVGGTGRGLLLGLVRRARKGRLDGQGKPMPESDRHYSSLINRMLDDALEWDAVPWQDFGYRWNKRCVFPLKDGGGWDTVAGQRIPVDDVIPLRLSGVWWLPCDTVDFGVLQDAGYDWCRDLVKPFLPMLDRMAWTAVRTEKSIDLVKLASINRGKSTMCESLMRAFDEGLHYRPSTKELPSGEGFSGILAPLGTAIWMVFDEADKIKKAGVAEADRLVSAQVEIHQKFLEPVSVGRTASPMMLGNDWPALDWTAAGMTGDGQSMGRADACNLLLDIDGDAPVINRGERNRMLSESGPWLRAWVLQRAQIYAALSDDAVFFDHCLPETKAALAAGMEQIAGLIKKANTEKMGAKIGDDVMQLVAQLEYTGDDGDAIAKGDLKEALGLRSGQNAAELQYAMQKKSNRKLKHARRNIRGNSVWAWIGWRWVGGNGEIEDLPDDWDIGDIVGADSESDETAMGESE